jgi:HD-GYP domain-containing protein (c-di-GMP phosphodiesterase class II)
MEKLRIDSGDGRADDAAQRRGRGSERDDGSDRGLAALREATGEYGRLSEELREERAANADLELRASLLQDANVAMQRQLAEQSDRTDRLLAALRQVHEALYRGTTSEYVLRASMQLTGAERGYYVSQASDGTLMVRAAIDVPATAGTPASPFIASIVQHVFDTGKAFTWGESGPPGMEAPQAGEDFRSGAAVPVSVHGEPHGVIIALDKDGQFAPEDVDSLLSIGRHAGVAVENARLSRQVQEAYLATIAVLADTVVAKDPYIHGHCQQVSRYARRAAELLDLDESEKRVTCYSALLHDVGKIGVSDGVLNKPGPLMAEERKLVEAHVRIGHDILNNIPALREVASAVLYHHERYDGAGYPDGLAGEQIPIASRIVGAVDAYCAMLDKRSYKEPMSAQAARAELERCSGTQFDPHVVSVVITAIADVDRAAAAGEFHDSGFSDSCGLMDFAGPQPHASRG